EGARAAVPFAWSSRGPKGVGVVGEPRDLQPRERWCWSRGRTAAGPLDGDEPKGGRRAGERERERTTVSAPYGARFVAPGRQSSSHDKRNYEALRVSFVAWLRVGDRRRVRHQYGRAGLGSDGWGGPRGGRCLERWERDGRIHHRRFGHGRSRHGRRRHGGKRREHGWSHQLYL